MLRDVLVHVDGSPAGRRPVQFALALAAKLDACLTGLHVTPPAEAPPLGKLTVVAEVERRPGNEARFLWRGGRFR